MEEMVAQGIVLLLEVEVQEALLALLRAQVRALQVQLALMERCSTT